MARIDALADSRSACPSLVSNYEALFEGFVIEFSVRVQTLRYSWVSIHKITTVALNAVVIESAIQLSPRILDIERHQDGNRYNQ